MTYADINKDDLRLMFIRMDRGKQFSRRGLSALHAYLTTIGHPSRHTEVDVVGLCCAYAEYPSIRAAERDGVRDPADHIITQGKGFIIVEIT